MRLFPVPSWPLLIGIEGSQVILGTVDSLKYKFEMFVKKEAFISLLILLVFPRTNSFTKKNVKTGFTDVCLVNSYFTFSLTDLSLRFLRGT